MSYTGKSGVMANKPYGVNIFSDKDEYGNPPPSPPVRYLLLENGQYLLLENGYRIELELGTP